MLIKQVAEIIEQHAPLSMGVDGDELGLLAGNPQTEVTGIVTCWSPTLAVLKKTVEAGANMVICHEPLTYGICGRDPEAHLLWYQEKHISAKIPNQRRLSLVLSEANSLSN